MSQCIHANAAPHAIITVMAMTDFMFTTPFFVSALYHIRGRFAVRGDIAVRTKLLRLLGKGFFRLLAEDGPERRDDALKLQFP